MRKPTNLAEAYVYWRRALTGARQPIIETEPHCGFYRLRWGRGKPWVPVAIWLHQDIDPATEELREDEKFLALVDGKSADPLTIWTYCAHHPIDEPDYRYRVEFGEWARQHAPNHPAANPDVQINLLDMEPVV